MTSQSAWTWLLTSSVLVSACSIQLGGTQERRLVTFDGIPATTATKVAQGYATPQQLAVLRRLAKAQFPNLTEPDLEALNLGWLVMALEDGQHVMLEITFMPKQAGVDAKVVADYVAESVRRDIRAMLVDPGAQ